MNYYIQFQDGQVWQGGSIERSLWNEMPLKPISKIEYTLFKHTLILENYESYNHLIEKTQSLLNDNRIKITRIILMAKKENRVYNFIFDLSDNEIKLEINEFGQEYYGKKTSGWKEGIEDSTPTYKVI